MLTTGHQSYLHLVVVDTVRGLGGCIFNRHPCWQMAFSLPCASRLPDGLPSTTSGTQVHSQFLPSMIMMSFNSSCRNNNHDVFYFFLQKQQPRPFYSVFAISTLDVLAHSLILGSSHHLYASCMYVLFLTAPPPFSSRIYFFRIPLLSLIYATSCDKIGAIDL